MTATKTIPASPTALEAIRDAIADFIVSGTNITVTHDDVGNTLTISSTGGGAGLTAEEVRDTVAAFVVAGSNVTVTHNDAANTLTLSASGSGGGTDVVLTDAPFGFVGDGSTNNDAAWVALGVYGRAETAAGRAVSIIAPPGVYNHNAANTLTALIGIEKLYFKGYGAAFQNTNGSYRLPFPHAAEPLVTTFPTNASWLIENTVVGATTFQLKTTAEHSNLAVGDWVSVQSFDIQYFGYPTNCEQFDFAQITAKNAGTGVFTVDRALKYSHRDDFPDGGVVSFPAGKARVWKLGHVYPWDIEHHYEGIEVRATIGHPGSDYLRMTGRDLTFTECVLAGISPSVNGITRILGGRTTDFNEPDKLVEMIIIDGHDAFCPTTLQSSSVDHISLRASRFRGQFTGGAKNLISDGCDFGAFSPGVSHGLARSSIFNGGRIRSYLYPWPTVGATSLTIDGVNTTYANGVISELKSVGITGFVIGQYINLCATGFGITDAFSGDLGTGIVLSTTEDATRVNVQTSLVYTTLPAWANGKVRIARNNVETYNGVSGSDNARLLSEASAMGERHWEYFKETFFGLTENDGNWSGRSGLLKRIRFNVRKVSPSANTRLRLIYGQAVTKDGMIDPLEYRITLDAMVLGERDFTLAALTGQTANDTVTLNAVTQTVLHPNRWFVGGTFDWAWVNYIPGSYTPREHPIIDVEMWFDTGMYRRTLTSWKDTLGSIMGGITGQLP